MSFNANKLMQLLPAVHRIRDAELAARHGLEQGPLESLMAVIAEQVAIIEESLAQGYDDLFVETCQDWVVPYIGDLIGYQGLHGNVPNISSPRAEVAHTIALRRRKGTVVVLEQLARDVTDWDARAVEYFQTLGWTQQSNHIRRDRFYAPDLRKTLELERIGTPFNKASFTTEVRNVRSARGKHNIPNIGIHLWRIDAYRHPQVPAVRAGERRYLISPLGNNIQLYSRPKLEDGFLTQLSKPVNVPEPLSRRQLHEQLDDYYGFRRTAGEPVDNDEPSIVLYVDGIEITRDQIRVSNLSDYGGTWAHEMENGYYGIDPVLGRVALPPDADDPVSVRVTWHSGFSADVGGGEYGRPETLSDESEGNFVQFPHADYASLQDAINDVEGNGVIEVTDSGVYQVSLSVSVNAEASITLRAADGQNPTLLLTDSLHISGGSNSRFAINGFCIAGNPLHVENTGSNELRELVIEHCTLVPGISLNQDGSPQLPGNENLRVAIEDVSVTLYRCITGPVRMATDANLFIEDSIVDAGNATSVALAGLDTAEIEIVAGPVSEIKTSTIIGKVFARELTLVSDSILLARLAEGDEAIGWNAPIWAQRKQTGCIRFSFLPFESIVPRRFRCQPDSAQNARRIAPRFTSLTFGQAAYCQLTAITSDLIRRGAEDESEMGAFHHLYAPQRETNLTIRLREYLRVGLQAGIFYQS